MIALVSFRSADGGEGVKIIAERDGEKITLTVSADDFLSLGIVKGDIDSCDFETIENAAAVYSAYRAAVRILSSGQCSAKTLYEKLRRRSFSHAAAKAAADMANSKGYIDEKWQIESYLRTLVEKKYCGRRKILPYLLAKGYSAAAVNAVLDEKYRECDFAKARKEFLLKKFGKTSPETRNEAEEMKKALYKQGY